MNFAVVGHDAARVTRSLIPPESVAAAAARLMDVGVTSGGDVMQVTSGAGVWTGSSSYVAAPVLAISSRERSER